MRTITIKAHELADALNSAYKYECKACGQKWKHKPISKCPGVPVVRWGKWGNELMTKTQLDEAGYQTGQNLPPVAAVVPHSKMPTGYMFLYNINYATKKRAVTPEQKAILDKARAKALDKIRCKSCGGYLSNKTRFDGICNHCRFVNKLNRYHNRAVELARLWLEDAQNIRIMDTETTNLWSAEIVEIAAIDGLGNTLLNRRVRPERPEKLLEEDDNGVCASDIHGILPEHLINEPSFVEVYPAIADALEDKPLVVYNYGFDVPILINQMIEHKIIADWKDNKFNGHCAMELYAQYCGQWSDYHKSFKWQKLPAGDHSALGDCLATLDIIKQMAQSELKEIAEFA